MSKSASAPCTLTTPLSSMFFPLRIYFAAGFYIYFLREGEFRCCAAAAAASLSAAINNQHSSTRPGENQNLISPMSEWRVQIFCEARDGILWRRAHAKTILAREICDWRLRSLLRRAAAPLFVYLFIHFGECRNCFYGSVPNTAALAQTTI